MGCNAWQRCQQGITGLRQGVILIPTEITPTCNLRAIFFSLLFVVINDALVAQRCRRGEITSRPGASPGPRKSVRLFGISASAISKIKLLLKQKIVKIRRTRHTTERGIQGRLDFASFLLVRLMQRNVPSTRSARPAVSMRRKRRICFSAHFKASAFMEIHICCGRYGFTAPGKTAKRGTWPK